MKGRDLRRGLRGGLSPPSPKVPGPASFFLSSSHLLSFSQARPTFEQGCFSVLPHLEGSHWVASLAGEHNTQVSPGQCMTAASLLCCRNVDAVRSSMHNARFTPTAQLLRSMLWRCSQVRQCAPDETSLNRSRTFSSKLLSLRECGNVGDASTEEGVAMRPLVI